MPHTRYVSGGSGNSFKLALVLRQAARSCAMRFVDVLAGQSRQPEFLAVNPLGQEPCLLTEHDIGLGEYNAIAWLLAEDTPLMPATPLARALTGRAPAALSLTALAP